MHDTGCLNFVNPLRVSDGTLREKRSAWTATPFLRGRLPAGQSRPRWAARMGAREPSQFAEVVGVESSPSADCCASHLRTGAAAVWSPSTPSSLRARVCEPSGAAFNRDSQRAGATLVPVSNEQALGFLAHLTLVVHQCRLGWGKRELLNSKPPTTTSGFWKFGSAS